MIFAILKSVNDRQVFEIQGLYGLLIKQYSRITEIPNEHSQRGASKGHSRR